MFLDFVKLLDKYTVGFRSRGFMGEHGGTNWTMTEECLLFLHQIGHWFPDTTLNGWIRIVVRYREACKDCKPKIRSVAPSHLGHSQKAPCQVKLT